MAPVFSQVWSYKDKTRITGGIYEEIIGSGIGSGYRV